jgi:hypothetical protein
MFFIFVFGWLSAKYAKFFHLHIAYHSVLFQGYFCPRALIRCVVTASNQSGFPEEGSSMPTQESQRRENKAPKGATPGQFGFGQDLGKESIGNDVRMAGRDKKNSRESGRLRINLSGS